MKFTNVQNLLFDLDGTLVDSRGTIKAALAHALEQTGAPPEADFSIERFIGIPLLDILRNEFKMSTQQAGAAIDCYREYYDRLNQAGTRVYPGVHDLLADLRDAGFRLFVATVKPTPIAEKVLSDLDLSSFFNGVSGASMGPERRDKSSVIAHVLAEFDLDPAQSLMIGDRDQDIAGARAHGLFALGVTYGFGSRDELRIAGADLLVDHAGDIAALLNRPRSD